jgi:hypothetical protein
MTQLNVKTVNKNKKLKTKKNKKKTKKREKNIKKLVARVIRSKQEFPAGKSEDGMSGTRWFSNK